ncbi:RlpA-like double-psi beta-barrel domain-containing protein [Aspergillus vadensis CBS 113365]|uniref:Allergen Asp F7 n=1 Tax=Aspergillus vadensis (strain CBS 113365 / IMI 142717 / IBT 24658) TaxID=1448311 RepID=A0A319BNM1_ASPVC|nr:hypothetical protein BO88DRAFT_108981 [Aspergillus vadensis CBS 113365]PYH73944.1 hypothetical protein BO88DRAFT_108981 [Aspergillus vadensis CBS 113365]
MAPLSKSLALAGTLFAAFGSAAPVEKRSTEVVYQTVTSVVWTTVDVTTTIYGAAPTESAAASPTPESQYQLPGNSQPEQSVNYQPSSFTTSTSTAWGAAWTPEPASSTTSTSTSEWEPAWTPAPTTSSSTSEWEPAWTPSTTSQEPAWTSGSPCTGDLTYYVAGLGSCGITSNGNTDMVVALPHGIMQDSDCGKTVKITYNGVTDYGTVWDKCMGCDDVSIDLSEKLFKKFGTESEGRLTGAEWYIE